MNSTRREWVDALNLVMMMNSGSRSYGLLYWPLLRSSLSTEFLLTVGHYLALLLVVDWVDGVVDGWSSPLLWSFPLEHPGLTQYKQVQLGG